MPGRTAPAKLRLLPLDALRPRADHGNAMRPRQRRALRRAIERTGCYPPIVVRPDPRRRGRYEILDGCERAAALRALGARRARCDVWDVDDAQALLVAATLNDLRGRSDARRRARRTRRLVHRLGRQAACGALALTGAALRQQLALLRPPRAEVRAAAADLRPLVFHLPAAEADRVERLLRAVAAPGDRRGDALAKALRAADRAP
jgi:hypothetical protein